MGNNIITLTKYKIEAWEQAYGLRDARYGGLVLGNRHSEGGVKMANEISPEVYSIAEMEGGEYLMSPEATVKYKKRLNEINSYKGEYDEISEERIKKTFSSLKMETAMEMLVLSGKDQYVINRNATSKYLEELDNMNKVSVIEILRAN